MCFYSSVKEGFLIRLRKESEPLFSMYIINIHYQKAEAKEPPPSDLGTV